MKKKKLFRPTIFTLLSCFVFWGIFPPVESHADRSTPPSWVENAPEDNSIYYGIGVVSTRKREAPDEEERTQAYNYAVTELSQMAGQMIYSSFKDYQREASSGKGENVAEQEVVSSIKNISENFLQGIEIRDRWQNSSAKQYYVFVAIDREEANRQIKENIAERETKLQKIINVGIKHLDRRMDKMEADVGRVDAKVGKVDSEVGTVKKSVGKLEGDLVKVDERVDKTSRDVSDLFDQMQFVKDKIDALNSGEMNWSKGLARVKGLGLANPKFPVALQKRSAEEAARMDAQSKLAELTNDIRIKVRTVSKDGMIEEDTKIRAFEGILHGAHQVGETIFSNDGTAEVIMEANVR